MIYVSAFELVLLFMKVMKNRLQTARYTSQIYWN